MSRPASLSPAHLGRRLLLVPMLVLATSAVSAEAMAAPSTDRAGAYQSAETGKDSHKPIATGDGRRMR